MVGLLRREHAGGLVQDQDVGAAEQRLEDLDPLLHAHRQARRPARRDRPRGRSRARAPRPRRGRARRRRPRVKPPSAPSSRFSRTVNGSTSMKCWWTMPMPALIASCGPADRRSAGRRPGSRRCRPGRSRRGCSSGSTCRRRSRRRCRGSCPAGTTRSMCRLAWTSAEALVDPAQLDRRGQRPRQRGGRRRRLSGSLLVGLDHQLAGDDRLLGLVDLGLHLGRQHRRGCCRRPRSRRRSPSGPGSPCRPSRCRPWRW